jgi:hypothetical protein
MLGVRVPPGVPSLRVPKAGSFGSQSVKLIFRGVERNHRGPPL